MAFAFFLILIFFFTFDKDLISLRILHTTKNILRSATFKTTHSLLLRAPLLSNNVHPSLRSTKSLLSCALGSLPIVNFRLLRRFYQCYYILGRQGDDSIVYQLLYITLHHEEIINGVNDKGNIWDYWFLILRGILTLAKLLDHVPLRFWIFCTTFLVRHILATIFAKA